MPCQATCSPPAHGHGTMSQMARGSPGCMSLKPSSHIAHVSRARDHSPAITGKSTSFSIALCSAPQPHERP